MPFYLLDPNKILTSAAIRDELHRRASGLLEGFVVLTIIGEDDKLFFFSEDNIMCRADRDKENPQTYKTLTWAAKRLTFHKKRMQDEGYEDFVIGIGFWIHPESHYKPLEKYMLMERAFPGCPTQ